MSNNSLLALQSQSLKSDFSHFSRIFDVQDLQQLSDVSYAKIQPRLTKAIQRFLALDSMDVLLISTPDLPFYRKITANWLQNEEKALRNRSVVYAENPSQEELFGYITKGDAVTENNSLVKHNGLLHQANNGILVLPLSYVLNNIGVWERLRQIQTEKQLTWRINEKHLSNNSLPQADELNFKLVLTGDRQLFATLEQFEPELFSGIALFAEYEFDFKLNQENFLHWAGFIRFLCAEFNLEKISDLSTLFAIADVGSRYMEEQFRVPLCPVWYQQILHEAYIESQLLGENIISKDSITLALQAKDERENYLQLRSREDIEGGQVIINCHGHETGQVNGLTVVTIAGHPKSYGEPSRISCVVHVGDGDISDVERKAELGGNIHAKGMMIMQAFVSASLELDHPLPFSASIVFEQSYSEVDGDSASLAELCSLVSALSKTPINQQIAVTGAVDQFGCVQAVGGINEKIESFFDICKHQKLTGSQGVILPKTNKYNLSLNQEVIDAVERGDFHIWLVETVDEAFSLITGIPFYKNSENEDSLIERISQRIQQIEHNDNEPQSWFNKLFR